MKISIIFTCVGGPLMPHFLDLVSASQTHEVTIYGVDMNGEAAGKFQCREFRRMPRGDDPDYVTRMLEFARDVGADLVWPTSDEEALALSEVRDQFLKVGCEIAAADYETLSILVDKGGCYDALREYGVSVPDYAVAENREDMLVVLDRILAQDGQAVIKPNTGRGGRGVFVVDNRLSTAVIEDDRREIHANRDDFVANYLEEAISHAPVMVMQRLQEPVFDLDMLTWKGEAVCIAPRRRVNSAVPNDGHMLVDGDDLIELGHTIATCFKTSWLLDCDLMFDVSGVARVLEINPRPSGSVVAPMTAGVPLFDDAISLFAGEKPPKREVPIGTVIRPYTSMRALP
ncbi:MAG: ATP-grasp domain-containing protein [Rhizobiaceae bacterium]